MVVIRRRSRVEVDRRPVGAADEQMAARGEHGGAAVRCQRLVGLTGYTGDADERRRGDGPLLKPLGRRDRDRHLVQPLRRQVEAPDPATQAEGDCVGAERRHIDVYIRDVGDLPRVATRRIGDPEVETTRRATIRQEIEAVPPPHRRSVGAGPAGDPGLPPRAQVVDEDVGSLSSEIALPAITAEGSEGAIEGKRMAVSGFAQQARGFHRELASETAGSRDRKGRDVPLREGGPSRRQEEHLASVGPPAGDHVVVGTG